jgi:uridine kinase
VGSASGGFVHQWLSSWWIEFIETLSRHPAGCRACRDTCRYSSDAGRQPLVGKRYPMPQQMLKELANIILAVKHDFPLRVGIDGIDAAGKTFLANELASFLTESGHTVIRASIDGFHNPKEIRHKRGSYSPEGYYYDSFNYEFIKDCLLKPLEPQGNRKYRFSAFDFKTEHETQIKELKASDTDMLIFEGVFLFRPELYPYWDFKIFVDINFQTSLARALERDIYLFGDKQEILKRYQERYIPGQQIYLESVNPKTKADVIIDNNDFMKPVITFCKKQV